MKFSTKTVARMTKMKRVYLRRLQWAKSAISPVLARLQARKKPTRSKHYR